MVLRADEIQSIEKNKQEREFDRKLKTGAKTVLGVGAIAAAPYLSGLTSKVAPFLNEFIPADLALKGISKVSPRLGSFLKNGLSKGLDLKKGLEFIKENLESSKPSQKNTNIIEQYSPELHQFIVSEIQKGRQPLEAGALAQLNKGYKNIIKKLENDHKSPFSALLESVYGSAQQPMQSNNSVQQPAQNNDQGLIDAIQKVLSM